VGHRARAYIEEQETITPAVVIAEFTDKYVREKLDPAERLLFIRMKSTIAVHDDRIAEAAGRINAERRVKVRGWGIVDSFILATARERGNKSNNW
jgi:predicted nucleic acid-binding protein